MPKPSSIARNYSPPSPSPPFHPSPLRLRATTASNGAATNKPALAAAPMTRNLSSAPAR